jgi:hypothetical protein
MGLSQWSGVAGVALPSEKSNVVKRGIIRVNPTRTADGLDFTAKDGKKQGNAAPRSLQVKPGARHPVWKTQSNIPENSATL